jgi:RNA polymerase sigma-70 factor (ECF subfamily)
MRPAEFSQVYEAHKALVLSVCHVYFPGNEKDDLFQEIWTEIFKSIDTFKGKAKLSTWIFSVARNTSLSYLEKQKRKAPHTAVLPASLPGAGSPEETVLSREKVNGILARLSPEFQEVLLQKYLFDQSYEELAEKLNIPVSTVKSRLFEARKKMRDFLFPESSA